METYTNPPIPFTMEERTRQRTDASESKTGLVQRKLSVNPRDFKEHPHWIKGRVYDEIDRHVSMVEASHPEYGRYNRTPYAEHWTDPGRDGVRFYSMETLITVGEPKNAEIGELVTGDALDVPLHFPDTFFRIKVPAPGKDIIQSLADGDDLPDHVFQRHELRGINRYIVWARIR